MPVIADPQTVELAAIDLSDPALFADGNPAALFARMRREEPVRWNAMPDEPGFWAVTKHEDIAAISRDTETFSSWEGGTMIRDEAVVPMEIWRQTMLNMDPPQHTEYRTLVNTAFTARRVAGLEPHIRQITRTLIDRALAKGEFDIVKDIAVPLPLQVICELLGVPPQDYDRLATWTSQAAGFDDISLRPEGYDALQAFAEGVAFFHELAERYRHDPQDNLITALHDSEACGRRLTEVELAAFLGLIAVGGTDTTRNSYAGGMLALIEHPEQRERLLRDPSLVTTAIEELVRWVTPFTHFRRTATRDTELRGVPIRAGEKVVMWYLSGNRDEEVFEDPMAFDVGRDPNRHQGFGGGGRHFCLGAGLARLELRILLEESLARLPALALAGSPRRVRSAWLTALHELPVQPA